MAWSIQGTHAADALQEYREETRPFLCSLRSDFAQGSAGLPALGDLTNSFVLSDGRAAFLTKARLTMLDRPDRKTP